MKFRPLTESADGATLLFKLLAQTNKTKLTLILTLTLTVLTKKSDVDKLERVQKRATKLIAELSRKSYSDRLKVLNLPTLKYRRCWGDMIELCTVGLKSDGMTGQTTRHFAARGSALSRIFLSMVDRFIDNNSVLVQFLLPAVDSLIHSG